MRSTAFRFSFLAGPLALTIGVGLAACAEQERAATTADTRTPDDSAEMGDPPTFATSDASPSGANSPVRGSPLCGVTPETCLPDDDGTMSTYATSCASARAASDASDASEAMPDRADACRLAKQGARYAPTCFRAEDGVGGGDPAGTDGVACETGADCAPGFECVESEKGPVCRRYCCMGSCESHISLSGGPTFCDVQKLVHPEVHLAPVCMPIKACKLLVDGECGANETCAIVTDKGATGCVARGSAREGDGCDDQHCGAGLTCLGNPGHRRCYKLCRTDRAGSDCGPAKTCTTGSIFPDHAIGVCKDP